MADIKTTKYNGVDTLLYLAELADAIKDVMPHLVIKPDSMNTWNVDTNQCPDGYCTSMRIYHESDKNNHIGKIGLEYWTSDKPKYTIQGINIKDGRETYGLDGQYKASIHVKNIVRVAKKVFKPFTLDQIADRCSQRFGASVTTLARNKHNEIEQKTCRDIAVFRGELENMYATGYTPAYQRIRDMMAYVVENKEYIDKYLHYSPANYFVMVNDNLIQYRHSTDKVVHTVKSKDELPDDVKGKLFVLDIGEQGTFMEDIGLKENDGAYWLIA